MAESMDVDQFTVAVESLHTTRVKEINYEGEEVYQEKPSLSQRLSEMARRVDFSEDHDGEEEESPAKKNAQKWPWEFAHSKLKQALTEVSVLSDVLHIIHGHRQYIALDPVASTATPPSIMYQYNIKKKALNVAAGIIRKGAEPFVNISMHSEREFHRALSDLRKRWRLRRTSSGVAGDLSYHSGGSTYAQLVPFELRKGSKGSGEALSVVVPRELRGQSEIVVFLCDQPVREVQSVAPLLHPAMVEQQQRCSTQLPPWERKLKAAQNVLFNQELFAQLAREAYDKRVDIQSEVFSDRINVPLSLDCWLSILLVREYEDKSDKNTQKKQPNLPKPNWLLSVALKQLLREHHRHNVSLQPPQPSNAGLGESPALRAAGSSALSTAAIKQLEYDSSLYDRFIKMAKHLYNETKLLKWLNSFCQKCKDPLVNVTWVPQLSLFSTLALITFHSNSDSRPQLPHSTLEVLLSVNQVTVQTAGNKPFLLPVDEQRLIDKLIQQIVIYRTKIVISCAEERKWRILHQSSLPAPSIAIFKSGGISSQACNLIIESPCGMRRIDLVIEYDRIRVSSQQDNYKSSVGGSRDLTLNTDDIKREVSFTHSTSSLPGAERSQSFVQCVSVLLDQLMLQR